MSYKNRERDYWQTLDLDIEKQSFLEAKLSLR